MPDGRQEGQPPNLSEMSEPSVELSIENKEERSTDALHHLDIPVRRRCGIRRMGRKYGITFEYLVPCKQRRCTLCAPKLTARRMAAVDDVVLYGREIPKDQREAFGKQFSRARQRGEDAAFTVIPTSYDTLLFVSEYEIGFSIDRDVVTDKMNSARTEWGNITSSKDWRPLKGPALHDDGSTDCGIITAEQEHLEQAARFLGLETIETLWDLRWYCDDPAHLQLLRAGGVMSDADYWAMIRLGHLPREEEPKYVTDWKTA